MTRLTLATCAASATRWGADISARPIPPAALAIRALLDEGACVAAADLPTAALAQEALCGRDQPGSARSHVTAPAARTPPPCAPGSPARPGGCSPTCRDLLGLDTERHSPNRSSPPAQSGR